MAAEYLKAKEEALEQLRAANVLNLKKLQEFGIEGDFYFIQKLGWTKQDQDMHPQFPIANQFSRLFLNFDIPTWNRYVYSNGLLRQEKIQAYRGYNYKGFRTYKHDEEAGRIVDSRDEITPEEIPFAQFSEKDLLDAAKTIEGHISKHTQVASI